VRLTPEIIAAMHELALEQRRELGVRAPWHVGDLTWGLYQHSDREHDWDFRTWTDGGRTVAWSWLRLPEGDLDHDVHPAHRHLLDEILDEPRAVKAFSFDDDEEYVAALARHGFVEPGRPTHFNARNLAEMPATPPLPEGFRCRNVGPADLAERVAIHRDVWAPSRVTESSFANVQGSWPYRGSLDCVVEAPDGRFAAYALMWPDDENRVGELEPVGVREEFRRRGLGAAVCTFALRRLHEEGGRSAIVYCANEGACALYESLGFQRQGSIRPYSR
jgi:GNAT superfamily N-acetyltransferase